MNNSVSNLQFTYLIGAGASADAIPIVVEFAKELRAFADYINNNTNPKYEQILINNSKVAEIRKSFIEGIDWLAEECDNHSNIDVIFSPDVTPFNRFEYVDLFFYGFIIFSHFFIHPTNCLPRDTSPRVVPS